MAVLEVSGLTKRYPGVTALDAVDLDVRPGEVHVLIGENGAGKSTMVRCLSGIERPDAGGMTLYGERYQPDSAADALQAGVRVVHQELALLPNLSVAENLFLHHLPHRAGVVDRSALNRMARDLLTEVGLDLSPRTPVERLGIAQMQLVEIAKALSGQCRLLIMDEPTATLTPKETGRLFEILRRLTATGVAVIYISHHLEEIFEIGDRVTVLRNGKHVTTQEVAGLTTAELVRFMVGRDLAHEYPPVRPRELGAELLRVTDLKITPAAPSLSLAVRAGEVVGVAGLVNSGRTEAMRAIFGADRSASGRVEVRGRPARLRHPRTAVRAGMSFLTEDRKAQGLVLDLSIAANMSLANLPAVSRFGLLNRAAEAASASALAEKLRVASRGVRQHVRALSGGNQQKVVLGRWLAADTDLLIVDEPTRGIDVGARYEIHQLLLDLADAGKGLLVVSSDLPELLGICDRIIVFSRGAIAGEVPRAEFDAERVLNLAYSGYLKGVAV
ncbi:sugar ABC transporter ATP-binding protein [Micromonospora avicenniae]|uniref:Monosaccharide ABC transporter ATP-binding protein, CUT2 family n=1 Tax=Micromonospora avicenniae TaxID=1198245 RepID=A0A1N6VYU1_9ACTN|nr:sugar ABC transporter ATP-binding protein [Micromonospora avicenniae]SIQ82980.1 monosaccharide ABC transporter ATP-binding protein, CUT2 family [Micromonospora avicenniae]